MWNAIAISTLSLLLACSTNQQQQQPEYGLGAPWPEASIDTATSTIRNELTVYLVSGVDEERISFLVDSLAHELRAAVRRTKTTTSEFYEFRWPPDLPNDRDAVIETLKTYPEFEQVLPGILVRPVGGHDPDR